MSKLRLLLVEDSSDDEKLLLREFKKAKYEVVYLCVQTPGALLDALAVAQWDVIISDFQMPGFSGTDVLLIVKKCGIDIPLIIVSGVIGEEKAVEAMRAGADDYLMKHNMQRLIPAVERAIREKNNRKLRQIAEKQRDEMRLRLEGIVSSAMDAIITTDENQCIVMVNKAAGHMFGYPETELAGKPLNMLIPHQFREKHPWYVREFAHSANTTRQISHNRTVYGLRSDASIFPVEASISQADVQGEKFFTVIIRDITEKLKATQALEDEKQRLELALLGGDLGLWDWDIPSGKIIFNSRWAERLGYTLEEIHHHFNAWADLIHPEDKPFVMQVLQAHVDGKISYFQAEYRIRCKDGSWKWMLDRGKVLLRNEKSEALRAVGTSLDITYKRKAEEKLRFEAQLLKLLDEGVIFLSKDFIIRSWSAGAEQIFKLPSSEVLGLELSQVLTIKYYENQLGYSLNALAASKETWKGEVMVIINNGPAYRIFATFTPLQDTEEGGYILVCKDIKEISAIQHRLIEQQSHMVSAIENAADAIFALNKNHELLYYNTAYKESFIKGMGKNVGVGDSLMAVVSEQGRRQIQKNWEKVQKGEKFNYDYIYTLPDGHTDYYEVYVNPIYGVNKEVIGASYRYRNLTEKRRIESEMQRMQAEIMQTKLQEQQLHTTALLEGQELERKRLARELHDGLGQMLNVLKMHLVRETASPASIQTVDEVIAEIIRVNNDLMPLVLQDFGLEAGIKRLVDSYQKITAAELYYFTDIGQKRFDPKLEINAYRVVQEALSNAVKYAEASSISVQVTLQTSMLLIMVEDDGIGFDTKKTSDGKGKGGYGLLNMKFRVEALNGKLLMETHPGRGCIINVELPV